MAQHSRPASRWLLSLLLLACEAHAASEDKVCSLASLQLRSADRPVDLVPPFSPNTFAYEATLDFVMETFSIDAKPSPGCEVGGEPNRPIAAPAGVKAGETTSRDSNIYARDPATGKEQGYRIKVSKLAGSETEVLNLRVEGGKLSPSFQPEVRSYSVALDIGQELLEVAYVLQDSGQKVAGEATPELLQTTLPPSRRLREAGESQYHERRQAFPIDVGALRQVKLTIESADPMQAAIGNYFLDVQRAGCNAATPLFDPVSATCVINCPERTYLNPSASRCSWCNENCGVCSSLTACELCVKDTIHRSYTIQQDGSCLEEQGRFMDKYYWWCVSAAVFGALMLCMGLGTFCHCLCDCCCSPKRAGYDSDLDWD